jgi:hypothetical protein
MMPIRPDTDLDPQHWKIMRKKFTGSVFKNVKWKIDAYFYLGGVQI